MKRYSLLVALIVLACAVLAEWPRKSTTEITLSTDAATSQQRQPKSCKTELAEDIPEVSFATARGFFLNRKHKIRAAGPVNRAGDLAGSIMTFGGKGKWLYVTYAELRYDPSRKLLGYSRLEGILHDGTIVRIDKTQQLPDTFKPVNNWSEIGPVIIKDIDGQMREKQTLAFEVTDEGRMVEKSDEAALNKGCIQPFGLRGGASLLKASFVQLKGPCRSGGAVNCTDFCFGRCRVINKDPSPDCTCENAPLGFCLVAPGLQCGGDCENEGGGNCTVVTPNPGTFFCGCVNILDQ